MKKTIILTLALILGLTLAYFIYNAAKDTPELQDKDTIDIKDTNNIGMDIDYNNTSSEGTESSASTDDAQTEDISASEGRTEGNYGNFYVYDQDGNKVLLSSKVETGKPVIINFWTTWCGYCKMEMPDFNDAYLEYGDRIEFMMVDINGGGNDNMETAKEYVESEGFEFPVYFDTDLSALQTYYTDGFPATIVIDSSANVVYAQAGALSAEQLQSIIDQIL